MKSILNPRSSILALLFALALGSFTALAQDTNATAPLAASAQIASGAATGLENSISNFSLTHPWVIGLLSLIGALRLCVKPLMTGLRYYVESTETEADDALLDEVEHSWLFTVFLFALDWLASIKLKPKTSSPALNKALSLLCVLCVLCGSMTACAPLDPAGVYHGDQVLHKSELITTTSYEVIHTYVTWEKENRAALAKYPEIKQSADVMRANAKQWFATANALHDAYAANPTPENGVALNTALAVLQTALNEAVKYMTQAAGTPSTASARP